MKRRNYKYFISYIIEINEENKIRIIYENTDINTNRKIKSLQDLWHIENNIVNTVSNYERVKILNYSLLSTGKNYFVGEIGKLK